MLVYGSHNPSLLLPLLILLLAGVASCDKEVEPQDCPGEVGPGGVCINREVTDVIPEREEPEDEEEALEDDTGSESIEPVCEPGFAECVDEHTVTACNEQGTALVTEPCEAEQLCDLGACLPVICEPGFVLGCSDPTTIEHCNQLGTRYARTACTDGTIMDSDLYPMNS